MLAHIKQFQWPNTRSLKFFAKPLMLAPASVFVSPGGVGQWVTTLYVDGTELLQRALVC